MSKKKIVIITGSELRHLFFASYLSNQDEIHVAKIFMEGLQGDLRSVVSAHSSDNSSRNQHLLSREESEKDFFEDYCKLALNKPNAVYIERNSINNEKYFEQICTLNPDLIISYGCSILRNPLLRYFERKIINVHLGLSPYYRGAGTNFWPFVNGELHFIGVTYMYIDEGIDTGEVIHQIRPRIYLGDNIHTIGNRLIKDMTVVCARLIANFDNISPVNQILTSSEYCKYYKKMHFTEESVVLAYNRLNNGLIKDYLQNRESLESMFPIVINPGMQ